MKKTPNPTKERRAAVAIVNRPLVLTLAAPTNAVAGIVAHRLRCGGDFTLSLGFGATPAEAGHHALASLQAGFDVAHAECAREWIAWQASLEDLEPSRVDGRGLYRISTAVLGTHEAEDFPGGAIASLGVGFLAGAA